MSSRHDGVNPWLLFVGPIICVVFPWAIPFVVGLAVWQAIKGGDVPRAAVTNATHRALSRQLGHEAYLEHLRRTRGPLPVYDDRPLLDKCLSCGNDVIYSPTLGRWMHADPDDACTDPPTPTREEASHGD